jgi:amino acid adenylation domain-containing protein
MDFAVDTLTSPTGLPAFPADRAWSPQASAGLGNASLALPEGMNPNARRLAAAAAVVIARTAVSPEATLRLPDGRLYHADLPPDTPLSKVEGCLRQMTDPDAFVQAALRITDEAPDDTPTGGDTTPTLWMDLRGGSRQLHLRHPAQLVAPISASDFLDKLNIVLQALAAPTQQRCGELSLIGPTARALIPDLTQALVPSTHIGAAQRFFEVASRLASQPAIAGDASSYTYAELARAVAHLAQQLQQQGLQPGEVVAVHGISSFGMLAGMLAVLAAGGVLVTLDATLPADRQALIARISQARHHIHVTADGQAADGVPMAAWPSAQQLQALSTQTWSPPELAENAPAYLFFTSGSTGTPKGVLGSHRGLAHFLDWQRSEFHIGPGDRAAQLTALSFDVVLRDILFPLTSGACIHIPQREWLLDARRMLRWIESSAITSMHCVPSLMKAWLQAHDSGQPLQTLKFLFFAGEPLVDALLVRVRQAASASTQIVNLYGPTETTLAKLFNRIDTIEPGVQPVGHAQPGVNVAILKDRRVACGLWETGEIAIRTPYRSHGYHGNPELTREVFVPNPWREDADDLIYFTGDLGRWRSDGKVEIFGRVDSQIKIRGVRIEPNEIEGHMLAVDGVRDAAVTVRAGSQGDKTLIGLVVAADESHAATDLAHRVKESLRQKLQEAMVPARVLVMDSLPYLPNGKLDRKTLAQLNLASSTAVEQRTDPQRQSLNPAALKLLGQLENLLGFPVERLDESFVALGGDSLSYVRASLLVEEALGQLPPKWEQQPLSTLLRSGRKAADGTAGNSRWQALTRTTSLESAMLFRAIAIVLVTLSHMPMAFALPSATPTLFAIAGLNFHRFLLPTAEQRGQFWPTVRFVLKFAVPAGLWQLMVGLKNQNLWWPDVVLLGTAIQKPGEAGWKLWFLDVLAANALLMALMAVTAWYLGARPKANQSPAGAPATASTREWGWIWLVLGFAISIFHDLTQWWNGPLAQDNISPFKWLWMLALGVLIAKADTTVRKWQLTALVGVLAAAKYSGIGLLEQTFALVDTFFFATLVGLTWIERVRLPVWLHRPVSIIAAATLFIYITGTQSIYGIGPRLGLDASSPWLLLMLALAFGVLSHWVWERAGDALSRWVRETGLLARLRQRPQPR